MCKKPTAHVLVIDDEKSLGVGISDLLELEGYRSSWCVSAEKGMEYLAENPETDCVLLDINLGEGLNGIEALSMIRERFKYVQVIMLTSQDTLETAVECMKKGAFDYMTKPFDENRFFEKVPVMLEKKRGIQLNDLYLGILVHDLKNPVSSIMASLQALELFLRGRLTDKQKRFLLGAHRGIRQITTMIDNILNISKFESGTLSCRKEKFVLKEQVEHNLLTFKDVAGIANLDFRLVFNVGDDYVLHTDKGFFMQVLQNLVSNAFRFTPSGKKVEAVFTEENGSLTVRVENEGSYIEEKEREAVFDKFYDVWADRSSKSWSNHGLGLTFSRMAVHAMGGEIGVACDREGPRTAFYFTIPR